MSGQGSGAWKIVTSRQACTHGCPHAVSVFPTFASRDVGARIASHAAMLPSNSNDLWAIVLAAGDGTRLRVLVELLHDRPIPKQFATLTGSSSLLQTTIARIQSLVPPS